jgi:hypothetical protein
LHLPSLGEACECVDERAQLTAALGQSVLDAWRAGVDHLPLKHAGVFEVGQTLREGCGRNAAERVQEFVEAEGARV